MWPAFKKNNIYFVKHLTELGFIWLFDIKIKIRWMCNVKGGGGETIFQQVRFFEISRVHCTLNNTLWFLWIIWNRVSSIREQIQTVDAFENSIATKHSTSNFKQWFAPNSFCTMIVRGGKFLQGWLKLAWQKCFSVFKLHKQYDAVT